MEVDEEKVLKEECQKRSVKRGDESKRQRTNYRVEPAGYLSSVGGTKYI